MADETPAEREERLQKAEDRLQRAKERHKEESQVPDQEATTVNSVMASQQ